MQFYLNIVVETFEKHSLQSQHKLTKHYVCQMNLSATFINFIPLPGLILTGNN